MQNTYGGEIKCLKEKEKLKSLRKKQEGRKERDRMDKKGNVLLVVLFALIFFMFGMLIVNLIKTDVTTARSELNCAVPSTDGDKVTCLFVDGTIPYFIIAIISIAGGYIINKKV